MTVAVDADWTLTWLKSSHFKTVLTAAGDDEAWIAMAAREAPEAKIHSLASGGMTVDQYAAQSGIRHLHSLKIGDPTRISEILAGAQRMLSHARIDFICFTIDTTGTCPLGSIMTMLDELGYCHVAEVDDARIFIEPDMAASINPRAAITAFNRRYRVMLDPRSPQGTDALFDIGEMTRRYGIGIRGIIHLGAHRGGELPTYMRLGAEQILMVEANPYLADRLTQQVDGLPGITVAHCAINDEDGEVTLNLTQNEQASSILPVSDFGRSMPRMELIGTATVRGVRLDRLIAEQGFAPDAFNILNVDIQGAELRALRGGEVTLRSIEAINIEVNFDEMYEGSAQIDDIDDHLHACGFKRVGLATPFDLTWGDAFYVRERQA